MRCQEKPKKSPRKIIKVKVKIKDKKRRYKEKTMGNKVAEILAKNHEKWKEHQYIFEKVEGKFVPHTYGDFYEDVTRAAAYLKEEGLTGKRLAIFGANSYAFMVADVAVMAYTGCSVMFAAQWTKKELLHIMKTVDVDAILYDSSKEEVFSDFDTTNREIKLISFDKLLENEKKSRPAPYPVNDGVCSRIVFSSGTTGVPKAVMLSQKNMFVNLENLLKRALMTSEDSTYLFLPLSNTYGGLCNFIYSLYTGMKIYLCSDKNKIVEELLEVKPTILSSVPIFLEKIYLAKREKGISAKALLGGRTRIVFCGGAILESHLREMMAEEGITLLNAYGLSETASLISVEYPDEQEVGSVGTVFENQDVRIDEDDENRVGEILVKGENIFIGYYGRENYYRSFITEDGYFRTGDMGYLRGNKLFLTGRKKRVIIGKNARNIYPEEIEAVILEVTKAENCKVFERDEKICAAIYTNIEADAKALLTVINENLPKYCHLAECEIVRNHLDRKWK